MSELVMRQMAMLNLVPRSKPGISTSDIESILNDQGFKVSRRTLQRDLERLSAIYPLVSEVQGRANYWRYAERGAQVLVPGMDLHTALTLKLTERYLQPLIPQRVRAFLEPYYPQADQVLQNHPSRLKSWTEKTRAISMGLPQVAPEINDEVWSVLTQSIVDQTLCEVSYQPLRRQEPKTYRISPLAIVLRGPVTYLLAVYEGYQDIRQMAMHRFSHARSLAESSVIPEGFCLDTYISEGHFGMLNGGTPAQVDLELAVTAPMLRILREAPLSENQQVIETPAGTRVRCTLPENQDLYRWLLSHLEEVTVIAPVAVRDKVKRDLNQALERYLFGDTI